MSKPETFYEFCWYLVQTHTKQEDRAESNLKSFGIETLSPKINGHRCNSYTGEITQHTKPLFPSYLFAKFKASDLYHKVRYTRGIRQLVSFGDYPVVIDEEIITMVRSRISEDGFARVYMIDDGALKLGDRVIIKDGPLKTFAGVFAHEMNGAGRVRILLQTVSYQTHVVIEREMIKKICE